MITIKDEVRHECKSGEVERHPDVNVVRGCCEFPEGLNNSCDLLGSTKFESSSFGSGSETASALSILRARMSRKKKKKAVERQVRKQGLAALERKPLGLALLRLLWRIFSQISSFVCIFVSLLVLLVEFGDPGVMLCSQFWLFFHEGNVQLE